MTIELIISLVALALAAFAAIRTFLNGDKTTNLPETEVKPKAKKEGTSEDVFKKTLQSIEDYRKHS